MQRCSRLHMYTACRPSIILATSATSPMGSRSGRRLALHLEVHQAERTRRLLHGGTQQPKPRTQQQQQQQSARRPSQPLVPRRQECMRAASPDPALPDTDPASLGQRRGSLPIPQQRPQIAQPQTACPRAQSCRLHRGLPLQGVLTPLAGSQSTCCPVHLTDWTCMGCLGALLCVRVRELIVVLLG